MKSFFLLFLTAGVLSAQNGKISGSVLDAQNGDPLIGCNVVIVGTNMGASTDLDGNFLMPKVPVGVYSLMASYIGYTSTTITNVKVFADQVAAIKISLQPEGIVGEEVVIEAKADLSNAGALLVEQKKAVVVSDAIGSQQISKTPDKSAGDALKRVTGLTVVGNKFVYVRGLGERYSNAQLNGVEIPSPEAEKKIIPMDIFPAGSLQNITVIKTYNPDISGDFSGGLVKIHTKEFPEKLYVSAGLSAGVNRASFGNVLRYGGGSTDFLGFDDGTRKRPNVPRFDQTTDIATVAQYHDRFQSTWSPIRHTVGPNSGFSVSVGNSYGDKSPIGFLGSLTYSQDFNERRETEFFPLADGTPAYDYRALKGSYSVLWGALADVNYKLNSMNKIGVKTVYNLQSDDEATEVFGFVNASSSGDVRATRLRFSSRTLFSSQLLGEHQIRSLANSKLEWHAAYSVAQRNEPDTRQTFYFLNQTTDVYEAASSSKNTRFFSNLDDRDVNVGLDWTLPTDQWLRGSKVKVGSLVKVKTREFDAFRYSYANIDESIKASSPENLFTSANIANGLMTFFDDTQPNDRYDADENTYAGYVMLDFPIADRLRFIGGGRYESFDLKLKTFDPAGTTDETLSPDFTDNDFFPAVNLVYNLQPEMNLRFGFSRTKARPQFRDLAPFRYDDYRRSTYGNPFLESTDISNFDLRWEYFTRPGEVLAVSVFYKHFKNPIERFLLPNPGNQAGDPTPVNGDDAQNVGLELEARKGFDFLGEFFSRFSANMNVSFIRSRVRQNDAIKVYVLGSNGPTIFNADGLAHRSRPMQGQSPFIVNIGLNYTNPETKTDVNVLYNVFGERLSEIGTRALNAQGENVYDDTYEEPFHQLDLTVTQKLGEHMKVKAGVKNLLDGKTVFSMGDWTTNAYKPGRSVSLGLSYDL
jgi:TonB-dependent receptor